MKIVMISGFLGAGKTTFIKEMAKKTQRQFVIVENEFGEIGVDGKLLEKDIQRINTDDDTEMKVWELTEGCICCSLNLDFTHSVLTIANALDPDYLIVEPSGVALPSQIIKKLNKITYERIQLSAPITIIDGSHYEQSKKRFPEYFNDQLSVAGTVAVSKSEKFSYNDFEDIKFNLHLREDVDFSMQHYSNWSKEKWFEILDKEMIVTENKDGTNNLALTFISHAPKVKENLENISIRDVHFNNIEQLSNSLLLLMTGYFGKVIRAKGYLTISNYWFKFDLVENEYAITGCENMEEEGVVVIGQNLNKEEISKLFYYNLS